MQLQFSNGVKITLGSCTKGRFVAFFGFCGDWGSRAMVTNPGQSPMIFVRRLVDWSRFRMPNSGIEHIGRGSIRAQRGRLWLNRKRRSTWAGAEHTAGTAMSTAEEISRS